MNNTLEQIDERKILISKFHLENILKPDEKDPKMLKLVCLRCPVKKSEPTSFNYNNTLKHLGSNKHLDSIKDANEKIFTKQVIHKLEELENQTQNLPQKKEETLEKSSGAQNKAKDKILLNFLLTEFIITNRLPFSIAPKLLAFIQNINSRFTSSLLKEASLSKTTATKITQICIAKTLKDKIFAELKISPFSLSLDASSDKFGANYLAIFVKYLESNDSKEPTTKLISVVKMGDSYTGETIFQKVQEEVLFDHEISRNFVGIVTDQAKSLTSEEVGLAGHVTSKYPYAIYVNDFSHIFNLVFKQSKKSFPKEIRGLVKKISSHFSVSPQRRAKLELIQVELGQEKLQVLKYIKTRWLSFRDCLFRILRIWPSLKVYYERHCSDRESKKLNDETEAYLTILSCLVDKLNYYNIEFQSTHLFYDKIFELLEEGFTRFALLVLNQYLSFEQVYDLPWDNEKNAELHKNLAENNEFFEKFLKDNYLEELNNKVKPEILNKMAQSAKNFIIRALSEMKQRLPFRSEILSDLGSIFFKKFDQNQLKKLAQKFSNMISKDEQRSFQNELERFAINFIKIQQIKFALHLTPLEVWYQQKESFPLLYRLAKAILILPHTTVPIERMFSQLKDFKTGKRNRISTKNLEASLLIYQNFGNSFESFITNEMMEKYPLIFRNQGELIQDPISEEKEERKETGEPEEIIENSFERLLTLDEETIQSREDRRSLRNPKKTKGPTTCQQKNLKMVKKTV